MIFSITVFVSLTCLVVVLNGGNYSSVGPTILPTYDPDSHVDTYRLQQIFSNATIANQFSSFWLKNNSNPCSWGADSNYIGCEFISSINETRIRNLSVYFTDGIANFSPAKDNPWPDYIEYIDLTGSDGNLQGTWGDFSNLPSTTTYFACESCSTLYGTMNWTTLPSSLKTLSIYHTSISAYYDDTSVLPRNFNVYITTNVCGCSNSYL